jgi:hypothetical protein
MVNTTLTNLFKGVIIKEDLIDTGRLLASVVVFTTINLNGSIIVNVDCEDYIKYLLTDYRIVYQFTNNDIFEREMEVMLTPFVEASIQDAIENPNTPTPVDFNPSVTILVNGR